MRRVIARWPVQWMLLLIVAAATGCSKSSNSVPAPVVVDVFVAASTAHVVEPLAASYQQATGVVMRCNAASSSTLAQQIEQGAPADIFLSANQQWMDHLVEAGLIRPGSRSDLLGNRIVLIAPKVADGDAAAISTPDTEVAEVLAGFDGWVAMADPDHVPAGMYGKEALESLGLWDAVSSQVIPAKDVRAALVLVEHGEADLGVVYTTDAASSESAVVKAVFPEDSHRPIRYPIALTTSASPAAQDVLEFLHGEESRRAFENAGFTFLGDPQNAR